MATALILRFRFNDDDSDRDIPQIARRIQFPVGVLAGRAKNRPADLRAQLGCIFFVVAVAAVVVGVIEYWTIQKRMAQHMGFVESGLCVTSLIRRCSR